jgi:hypothetical protein
MYINLNMFFFKFIMAGGIFGPLKGRQKIPVGSQAHRVLYCLPKADELFIATELACESSLLYRDTSWLIRKFLGCDRKFPQTVLPPFATSSSLQHMHIPGAPDALMTYPVNLTYFC